MVRVERVVKILIKNAWLLNLQEYLQRKNYCKIKDLLTTTSYFYVN